MKRIFSILSFLLILSTHLYGQVANDYNVYCFPTRYDDQAEAYFNNNGFTTKNLHIMTHGIIFLDGDPWKINTTNIQNFLNKYFPDVNSRGMVVLDNEIGPYYDLRNYPATDYRFKNAEAYYIKLINEVRRTRPYLKISVYALPFSVWSDWQIDNYNVDGKLNNLISKMDFITNSMYVVYADEEVGRERVLKYFRDNLNFALAYGKRLNKPVYPFLWFRIHPFTSKYYKRQIIQKDTFAAYVKYVATYTYNDYKTKGFFLWDDVSGRLENLGGIKYWLDGTVYNAYTYDAMAVNFAKAIKSVLQSVLGAPGSTTSPDDDTESSTTQKVTSFTLYNNDTNQPIKTIYDGSTIYLSTLPTKYLDIRANTNPDIVGSVKFVLSGDKYHTNTENGSPYTLAGTSYWTPSVGSYTLKATPYTGSSGSGSAGTSLTISFKVVY